VHPVADMANEQGERKFDDEAERLAGEAALVIDPRLADLWQMIWSLPEEAEQAPGAVPLGTLAPLLRVAYALGYADAHGEESSGLLYRELGLRSEARTSRTTRRSRRGRAGRGNSDT